MIITLLRIVSCTLFPTCSRSGPINEITAVGPGSQLDEFIDGEIVCTGHLLEDNFEDNLASAAASKYYIPSLINLQSSMGDDRPDLSVRIDWNRGEDGQEGKDQSHEPPHTQRQI